MRIAYDADNLHGAGSCVRRMVGISDEGSAAKWIELATAKAFATGHGKVDDFVVLHRGFGFFWGTEGHTNAPMFETEVSDTEFPDLIWVSYWVAADAPWCE